MLKPSRFTQLLYRLEAFAYAKAVGVSGISRGMIRAFEKKNVPPEKIIFFPNGVAVPGPDYFPEQGAFRKKHRIAPEVSVATYSGNLGAKQGLDILLDAAEKLIDQPIQIVICGDGALRMAMEQQVAERKLKNLLLLPLQDETGYREMQVDTSVSLITQHKGTGQFFFPSKLLSAMLFRKPVLAVADSDSELAHAVRDSESGYVVEPGDVDGLASALMEMCPPEKQRVLGQNGKKWVSKFAFEVVHGNFEDRLLKLASSHE